MSPNFLFLIFLVLILFTVVVSLRAVYTEMQLDNSDVLHSLFQVGHLLGYFRRKDVLALATGVYVVLCVVCECMGVMCMCSVLVYCCCLALFTYNS